MSFKTIIIGFLIIIGLYLILSKYFLERVLKIKGVNKSVLSKERKRMYVYIEYGLLGLFIIISFLLFSFHLYLLPSYLVFIFLFTLCVLRGVEEWRENKNQKGYYHEWLTALMFLALFFFALIGFSSLI